MTVLLFLAVEGRRQYPRSPLFWGRVLQLVSESAVPNNALQPTAQQLRGFALAELHRQTERGNESRGAR